MVTKVGHLRQGQKKARFGAFWALKGPYIKERKSAGDERRSIDGVQTYFARKRSKYLEGSFYMLSWGILNGDTNEAMRNRPAP